MPVVSRLILLVIVAAAISSFGCKANVTTGNANGGQSAVNNANTTNTNEEELGVLIPIPYDAEDVVWRQNATTKKITAVLRFLPADAIKLVEEAEKKKPAEPVDVSVETWFPDELIAQNDMSGGDILHGKAYAADQFFQAPYESGRITRIDGTDYFVLELNAKQ